MTKKRQQGASARRYVSKTTRSKWQRQKRIRNIIVGVGSVIITAVVVTVGVGLYNSEIKPYAHKAITVNDVSFDMRYYINMLELSKTFYAGLGLGDYLLDRVKEDIQRRELVRQDAAVLGIEVDMEEAKAELEEDGIPVTREYVDVKAYELLMDRLREEYFAPQVFPNQLHVHPLAMFLDSENVAEWVKGRLEEGDDFATLAEEYSEEPVTLSEQGDLGLVPLPILERLFGDSKLVEIVSQAEVGVTIGPVFDGEVTKTVGFWVARNLEIEDDPDKENNPQRVHVEGILVGSTDEAEAVKDKLLTGESFADLASELSLDAISKEDGGDLGWLPRGAKSPEFSDAVFALATGELSDPIRDPSAATKGGYWLVQVLDRDEDGSLSDEHLEILVGYKVDNWVSGLWEDSDDRVESFLDAESRSFALGEIRDS